MHRYLVLYRSRATAADQMASADLAAGAASMEAWMQWATHAGESIVDLGSPTQTIAGPDPGAESFIGGYSILQARNLGAIQRVLDGHPHVAWGGTIEILEMLTPPGM